MWGHMADMFLAPLILMMVLAVSPSASYDTPSSPPVCGAPVVSGQAIEGADALDGQWPWQVSVRYSGAHICGGSLITGQWVLSAAHCFINSNNLEQYSVYLGKHQLSAEDNDTTIAQVSEIIRHPQYNNLRGRGDIALLKLSSPVTYTQDIIPICLPSAAVTFPCGMECWVTGRGNTSINGNQVFPRSLQKVMTSLIDHRRCDRLYHVGSSGNVSIILDDMICSDSRVRGKGPCQADSGGPLMYEVQGVWYQAGVISWGYGCTDIDRAAVYAMVPAYISWIQSYVPELILHNVGSFSKPTIDCDQSYTASAVPDVSSLGPRAAGSVCGSPLVSSRIVGGTDAVPGEWPWQISLYHRSGLLYYPICGGSLIASQWVMTAAHCVNTDLIPNNYLVILGANKLQNVSSDPNVVKSEVLYFVYNGQYTGVTSGGDIALIELLTPVTYTRYIMPICLPSASVIFPCGMECWVSGWGNIYTGVSLSAPYTLQKVTAPLMDRTECDKMYHEGSDVSSNKRIILDDMICAGYAEGQRSTCQGDSGGPLVCKVRGVWYEVGIVSFGVKCAQARKPTVYTLVTSYQSWIQRYVPGITFSTVTNIPEPSVRCSGSFCRPDPMWTLLILLTMILSSL